MKIHLLTTLIVLALAGTAHAQLFDLTFTSGNTTATGTLNATNDGGGIFTATSGTLSFSGETFHLDPVPSGESIITLHDIITFNGDVSGDDEFGVSFVS